MSSCMPKRWPREAEPARRIAPQIPPIVDRLIRDMVNARVQGDQAEVAEITGETENRIDKQFEQTNHMLLRTFVGWLAQVGPERASRACSPAFRHLGLALVPNGEADDVDGEDQATGLIRLQERLGELAASHLAAWANRRLDPVELAELERLGACIKQTVDVYMAGARICAGGRA